MTISVKLTADNSSIVTVYDPTQRLFFFRPLHLTELETLCEYGEAIGMNRLLQTFNTKKFNGRAYGQR